VYPTFASLVHLLFERIGFSLTLKSRVKRWVRFLVQLFLEVYSPANTIDRLVSRRLDEPGARVVGDPRRPPLIHRGGEGFLRDIFSEIEVAEESDERSNNSTPIRVINVLERDVRVQEHT